MEKSESASVNKIRKAFCNERIGSVIQFAIYTGCRRLSCQPLETVLNI